MLAPTPNRKPYVKSITYMLGEMDPRRQPLAAMIQPIIVVARQPSFWHKLVAKGPSKNIRPYVREPTTAGKERHGLVTYKLNFMTWLDSK